MKKNQRKKLFVIVTVILVVIVACICAFLLRRKSPPQLANDKTATIEQRPVGQVDSGPPSNEQRNPASDNTSMSPKKTAPDAPIAVSFSYIGGDPLQIRVVMNELFSEGTCTLTLKKSGAIIYSQQAGLFPTATTTTCRGFSIDKVSLTPGIYVLTLKVTSGSRNGYADKEIAL